MIDKKDLTLSTSDKVVLRELVAVFDQFEEVTKLVQGDKYASLSLALPCFIGLQKHLDEVNVRRLVSLVRVLKDSLQKRFGYIRSDPLFIISTILDPEFKLSWVSNNTELINAKQTILKELEKIALQTGYTRPSIDDVASNEEDEDADSEPVTKRRKLFSFMEKSHISKEAKSAQQEIDDYLLAIHTKEEIKEGSLEYWKKNGLRFPLLRKLAQQYLSVPATSAPVERVFSTAGKIIRQDRCRLLPVNFERLLFLKTNSALL